MLKSLFIAVSIYTIAVGLETLCIKSIVWRGAQTETVQGWMERAAPNGLKDFHVQEHHPFLIMAGGAVLLLWTFTIPKKGK